MAQIVFKILATALVFAVFIAALVYIWTGEIDINQTLLKPVEALLPAKKKRASFDVNYNNSIAARLRMVGNAFNGGPCLIFYELNFVNSTANTITVKSIHLRYQIDSATKEVDTLYMATGRIASPRGPQEAILIEDVARHANIILVGWKNIKQSILEYEPLVPGAVLGGSAVFLLEAKDPQDFAKMKNFELVARDYAGEEWPVDIETQERWAKDVLSNFLETRSFTSEGTQQPPVFDPGNSGAH